MEFAPFLLDQWLQSHSDPLIELDLGSSTGPHWTLRELLGLGGEDATERLARLELIYSPTAGGRRLREAIAEMLGVSAEHVVVTAGAAEALLHVFLLAASPGANVVVPFPCFPPHRNVPQALGVEVRQYHLRREDSFRIDLDAVRRLADARTKLILVNQPHNPTGATLDEAEMRSLHDFAAERGIQFVSDEVYHPVYHGPASASAARFTHATSIGDFSKALSLSGLRLGWIIEPDARRRRQYLNAREHVTISNTPIAEYLAEIAVQRRDLILGRTREVTRANLEHLDRLFAKRGDVLRWVRPQGGTTTFPWFVSGADALPFCELAATRGLLLVPGDCFGMPEHLRIGFGVGREWFPRAVERLEELLCGEADVRGVARSVVVAPERVASTPGTNLDGPQPSGGAALACRPDELTREEWSRRNALHDALKRSTEEVIETSDGWAFRLRADPAVFWAAAEWLTLERRCCPFLSFELRWAGGAADPWLRLGDPEGVKDYLAPGARALRTRNSPS